VSRSFQIITLVVVIGFAVYAGFVITGAIGSDSESKASTEQAKLEQALRDDSSYAERILNLEDDAPGLSYDELFTLCNKAIEQHTALMAQLQGIYPSIDLQLKARLIAYLDAANEVTREKKALFQDEQEAFKFNFNNKIESHQGFATYHVSARINALKPLQEYDRAAYRFQKAYEKVLKLEYAAEEQAKRCNIRFTPVFRTYQGSNFERAELAHQISARYINVAEP
jgi:hypothetical protein